MKIAYLLGSLNRGGTETLLLDVFRNSKQQRLDAIGVYRKSGVLEQEFIQSGVPMHKRSVNGNVIVYLFRLRKLLISNKVDIVHAQQPLDALFAYLACIGINKKIVLSVHGYDFAEKSSGKLLLRYILKHTDTNIFVSEYQRQYFQRKYTLKSQKQQVVYNGISFDKLDASAIRSTTLSRTTDKIDEITIDKKTLREELHISSNTILLGTVGNFVPGRDQLTLCRFLKRLNEEQVNFHFVFVGKKTEGMPDLYDTCFDFCKLNKLLERTSFLGSRNDVPEILHELDAFLYATDHDTFGIAVVEAMAAGIPVFVNDWGVMTEITDAGKYATIYKTRDEDDLLKQFMLFLQNKTAYQAKATEAARFVREKYSIEKHIDALRQVYSRHCP
jgi:glycosyltransferase involved in cell wall biosynthesis